MPDWCRTQLDDIREIVDRAAWMLWAGSEAANRQGDVCSDPPGSPHLTASLVYDMVKPAYRELCAKFDEYQAAEKPAIDKQYEVHGLHQAAERGVAPHAGDAQRDGGVPMTAEIIRLPVGIPGIGRAGDCVVHDPDHTDPRFRLSNVHPLDLDHLAEIKEKVREWEEAAKRKEVVS